jgi:Contractile injection system tube protein
MTTPSAQPDERPTKAKLYKLNVKRSGTADKPPIVLPDSDPIEVQFNPTSLKIDRKNDTSGGAQAKAQRRNRPNEGHAVLSVDLEFDTAEGGPDGQALDVRKLTQNVRQFAEAPKDKPKDPPPAIRFVWGEFQFDGIVERLGEEIDYFSPNGRALRAKVTLSITGQDPAFEATSSGPGARDDKDATDPGGIQKKPGGTQNKPGGAQTNTGPNAPPTRNPAQAVAAQDGESVQQLLSRLDADPATWRSAMAGLTSPLDLAAGTQVQLSASVTVDAGIGVAAGFGTGTGVGDATSADASTGASADGTVGFAAEASVGFALSAGGGVDAAAGRTLSRAADQAVANTRGSFDVPGSAADGPSAGGGASAGGPGNAPPDVDRRAASYGYGVPLRPRVVPLASPAPAVPNAPADAAQRDRDARPSTLRWSPCSTGRCQR